jgi:Putative zinc-finger/WD40-like Beta Propeller Repeat
MNCKWAEGHLSECLDGTLDPAVRDEVVAHVESCSNCKAILDDYRYFDGLVGSLPRYEPSPELRDRIFASPEFAEILHSLNGHGATLSHPSVLSHPVTMTSQAPESDSPAAAHDRPLGPLPFAADLPAPEAPAPAGGGGEAEPARRRHRGGAPPWVRIGIGLSAAAAVVVMVGSALLIKQGLSDHRKPGEPSITNVGGFPGQTPLPAGSRVVFERQGALWSAPEQGGAAQRLTSSSVIVGSGWVVSPVRNGAGGDRVAYIDLKTGLMHVVRSDDQSDHTVGQRVVPADMVSAAIWSSAERQAILGGLAWSPDGTRLAYLVDADGTGHLSLAVVGADGSGAALVSPTGSSSLSLATWSPDGLRVAYVQTTDAGQQSVWEYNTAEKQSLQVSTSAAPGGSGTAVVRKIGWMASSAGAVVTWASGDTASGSYSGLYAFHILVDSQPRALTPPGWSFSAADFSAAAPGGGSWLLGDGAALYEVPALYGGRMQLVAVPGGVGEVAWAADGSSAALVTGSGELRVWAHGALSGTLASGVALQPALAWAPDGSALAFVGIDGHIAIVRIGSAGPQAAASVSGLSGATALAWAPDAQTLAVSTETGVSLVGSSGAVQVDAHSAEGRLVWSVAR